MTLDERVEAARRLLRDRRLLVEPDLHFADRVVARLPQAEIWMLAWAARRVLPVTLAVAAVLMVAILATGRPTASTSSTSTLDTQRTSDPLDWVMGQEDLN